MKVLKRQYFKQNIKQNIYCIRKGIIPSKLSRRYEVMRIIILQSSLLWSGPKQAKKTLILNSNSN